ncbi:matrixin family metalloprotease [Pyxidicoccus fallax]|uniref:Matrixin family metalloprotease n=1 Tax=Pyxidicoccus fallax TaxID=394095 RepID=A0A848LV98_9BACT|nr:M57 family metalloprotease [Pyxidicoccus fallax]NMO21716.1 matrixin family metalloprotease [Pyxidicoccus fallax]NPC83160.1 matrixin family metalloprotease [Pyxidicoccus fallax]
MLKFRSVALMAGVALLGTACGGPEASETQAPTMSWEEFQANAFQDVEGKYIIDGDMAFDSKEQLKEFFDENIAKDTGSSEGGLAVYSISGSDIKWSTTQARNLTYCISTTSFGTRKSAMVTAMNSATAAWEATANVNFVHSTTYDSNCTATQTGVLFDVRMVSGQSYLARAFFPNSARSSRNVLVDSSSFGSIAPWTLAGIMRHELGHVLGFRHEHTRSTASGCYEDANWRALTSYDRASVMHYPQCNGTQTGDLILTSLDKTGARALYP